MSTTKHTPEQISAKMKEINALTDDGLTVAAAATRCGIAEKTYYRWRNRFANLNHEQIEQLRKLKIENRRLRQTLQILREQLLGRKRA